MRGIVDRSVNPKIQIKGLKISLGGRLHGADRSKTKYLKYGVLKSKYQMLLRDHNVVPDIMTKWGKIGLKIERNLILDSSALYFRVKRVWGIN